MNIREGMRRVTLSVSILGFLAGAFLAYSEVTGMMERNKEYARFNNLAKRPSVKNAAAFIVALPKRTPFETVQIDKEGIKKIEMRDDKISVIETDDGARFYDIGELSFGELALFTVAPPAVGALVPWSIFWFVCWIARGFSARPGSSPDV